MPNSDELPQCLRILSLKQKDQIQTTLANDEASTDEEIIELWTQECSVPREAAEAAIKYRPQFFVNGHLDLFGLFE